MLLYIDSFKVDILTTSLLLIVISWAIYQTWLSPLSKFPGPFWGKFSPYWSLYQYIGGKRYKTLQHLHKKHGDIIRVGLNELSICNVDAQKAIYGNGSSFVKAPNYRAIPQDMKYLSIVTETDPAIHNMVKRSLAHAFSAKALDLMEDYVQANINTFCNSIRNYGKEGQVAMDLSKWITYLTFDVLGDLGFGKPFGFLKEESSKVLIDVISRNIYFNGLLLACPASSPFLRMVTGLKGTKKKTIQHMMSRINERFANPSDRKDFFYYLTDSTRSNTSHEEMCKRLVVNCVVLITAGSDTSAAVLTAAIYLLASHGRVLEKLRHELVERFPDSSYPIEHQKTTDLPYLNAVIEEVMRLYPAALGPLPRVSPNVTLIAKQSVPANTVVSIASHAICRDPRYFTEPDRFIPERWIDSGYERDQTLGRLASQPFSLGPRSCLGRNMAYMEIRLCLTHFVLNFQPELENPDSGFEMTDYWLAYTQPLFVKCHSLTRE